MKKIIIISALFMPIFAGVLYGTTQQPEKDENVMVEQVCLNHYPEKISDIAMETNDQFSLSIQVIF